MYRACHHDRRQVRVCYHGETVLATEEFAPAFERALSAQRPALLHVRVDPQALTMSATLDDLRAQGMAHTVRDE